MRLRDKVTIERVELLHVERLSIEFQARSYCYDLSTMQFSQYTLAVLAFLPPTVLGILLPANGYRCFGKTTPAECQGAIAELQKREARGCNVASMLRDFRLEHTN